MGTLTSVPLEAVEEACSQFSSGVEAKTSGKKRRVLVLGLQIKIKTEYFSVYMTLNMYL